jgi:hypothetical protein
MGLRPGNTKLGLLIHAWSIPSGLKEICVGASAVCLMLCYAMRQHYCRDNVKEALARNYRETLLKDFVAVMGGWIRSVFARVVRVHASGEFYSDEYVRKWVTIAKRNPKVVFFSYTRSWRDPDVYLALKELAALPNFVLWWSCDKETGAPPRLKGVRRAYLMTDDDDVPRYGVDLVFREKTQTTMKWVKDALVCPPENGVTENVTCSVCQLCFNTDKHIPKRRNDGLHRALPAAHLQESAAAGSLQ